MLLKLAKPLAAVHLDSTGLDPRTARIIRISVLKISVDGGKHSRSVLINPGIPIPAGATAIHGITSDLLTGKPTFEAYARSLAEHLADCDITGFGIERYGLPLLKSEFNRAGIRFSEEERAIIDTMTIFHRKEPRDFRAAHLRFAGSELPEYPTPCEALEATISVLEGELDEYDDLPRDVAGLNSWIHRIPDGSVDSTSRFVWSDDGQAVFNFGRHQGRLIADVLSEKPDYLEWVASNPDFPKDVREIAQDAIAGKLPRQKS